MNPCLRIAQLPRYARLARCGAVVVVDSDWTVPLRVVTKRFFHNPLTWLGALVAANLVFAGVGVSAPDGAASRAPIDAARPLAEQPPASLRLVSEIPHDNDAQLAQLAAPQPELQCLSYGPFNDQEALATLRTRIEESGGTSEVHQSQVFEDPDYLVYVGQRGKADNARRVLQELKSQSIDSALIVRGPYNNTLSVGVFSRPERAERQRAMVAKLGYEVGVETIDRSYDVYHLEARIPADFLVSEANGKPCAAIAQAH